MAGRDSIGAESVRAIEQRGELQIAVAAGARQRGAPGGVLTHEIRDDVLVKLPLEVDDVVRNANRRGDAAGVVQIVERAAAAERRHAFGLIVELHRQADDLVALVREQGGGHRRVDAAGHCNHYAHLDRNRSRDIDGAEVWRQSARVRTNRKPLSSRRPQRALCVRCELCG